MCFLQDRCEQEGLYSDLQHSAADLYQTTTAQENMTPRWARKATVAHLKQEINREIYEDGDIYENVNQDLFSGCNRTELWSGSTLKIILLFCDIRDHFHVCS